MNFWMPALLAGLLLGCKPAVPDTLRDYTGADELNALGDALAVSLRIMVPTKDGERLLAEEGALSNNDPFSLMVRVSKPAYLNIVHFAADGSVNVLFPKDGYHLIPASCPVRLPQRKPLYLQGMAGAEDLHVVATLRPLAEVDPRLCEELRMPCDAAPTAPKTASCSPTALMKTPPAVLPSDPLAKNRAIFNHMKIGRDAGQGVASLSFSVRHVR